MLSELCISNFALIENITINFKEGLNIFTGSTGVGKSLILGALNFLLGSRTTSDIVRVKEEETIVSGIFFIKDEYIINEINRIVDGSLSDEIIIQRSLDCSGRNKCKLNNQPITVAVLKEIGDLLVNIHGQHEHEALTIPLNQLTILDSYGKINTQKEKYCELYNEANGKEKLLISLKENMATRNRQVDLYRFEIDEIENASLSSGEMEVLACERNILVNAEKIQQTLAFSLDNLYETDNSIITKLREVTNELDKIKHLDNEFNSLTENCNHSVYQLEDVVQTLRSKIDSFDFNPGRLEEIEQRLETISRLKNKYGETIEDILNYLQESQEKLNKLLKENEDLGDGEKKLAELKCKVFENGQKLTELRKKAGTKLSNAIKNELGDLGIANGEFNVDVTGIEATEVESFNLADATNVGFDNVEFMFSSNPGEKVRPLRKVASGGEMSRVMLALKSQLALEDHTPVLIFDEIDANIGGRMGRIIGEKLKSVAIHHQLVCITHLPQIASYADQHLKVNKSVRNNKTFVRIDLLNDKEQLEEIAEMIRGDEKTTVTRKQAKEMIDDAGKFLKKIKPVKKKQ